MKMTKEMVLMGVLLWVCVNCGSCCYYCIGLHCIVGIRKNEVTYVFKEICSAVLKKQKRRRRQVADLLVFILCKVKMTILLPISFISSQSSFTRKPANTATQYYILTQVMLEIFCPSFSYFLSLFQKLLFY